MFQSTKPSPAMVVALLALLFALAGTAFAIGNNSVGADQLAKVKQRSKEVAVPGGEHVAVRVKCKKGEELLGGGATLPGANPEERPSIEQSGPVGPRKWFAAAANDDSLEEATIRVTVICLSR